MDLVDSLDHTFRHAHGVIGNIRAGQYDNKTPCEEWTVRDLLEHTIGVVAGIGATASGEERTPFELGADPAAQFSDVAASTLAAWRSPGVFDQMLDIGSGPMPGRPTGSPRRPSNVASPTVTATRPRSAPTAGPR